MYKNGSDADETRAPSLTLSRFAREGTYRTIYPIRRRAAQPIIPNIPTIRITTALGSGTATATVAPLSVAVNGSP
jgi:hypothetical protein